MTLVRLTLLVGLFILITARRPRFDALPVALAFTLWCSPWCSQTPAVSFYRSFAMLLDLPAQCWCPACVYHLVCISGMHTLLVASASSSLVRSKCSLLINFPSHHSKRLQCRHHPPASQFPLPVVPLLAASSSGIF